MSISPQLGPAVAAFQNEVFLLHDPILGPAARASSGGHFVKIHRRIECGKIKVGDYSLKLAYLHIIYFRCSFQNEVFLLCKRGNHSVRF